MDEQLYNKRLRAVINQLAVLEKEAAQRRFAYLRQMILAVSALLGLIIPLTQKSSHSTPLLQETLLAGVVLLSTAFVTISLLLYYSQCIAPAREIKSFRKEAPKSLYTDERFLSYGTPLPCWYNVLEFSAYLITSSGVVALCVSFYFKFYS